MEIKNTKYKGRGLFAKRDIKKGELLIVEKVFVSSYDSKLDEY